MTVEVIRGETGPAPLRGRIVAVKDESGERPVVRRSTGPNGSHSTMPPLSVLDVTTTMPSHG